MVTVYLTRHGQTVWNLDKRLQGSGNSELTDHGIEQAEQLKKRVDSIQLDTIYTSPLERARKTANIIRGNRNIEIIEVDAFKEISFGEYTKDKRQSFLRLPFFGYKGREERKENCGDGIKSITVSI